MSVFKRKFRELFERLGGNGKVFNASDEDDRLRNGSVHNLDYEENPVLSNFNFQRPPMNALTTNNKRQKPINVFPPVGEIEDQMQQQGQQFKAKLKANLKQLETTEKELNALNLEYEANERKLKAKTEELRVVRRENAERHQRKAFRCSAYTFQAASRHIYHNDYRQDFQPRQEKDCLVPVICPTIFTGEPDEMTTEVETASRHQEFSECHPEIPARSEFSLPVGLPYHHEESNEQLQLECELQFQTLTSDFYFEETMPTRNSMQSEYLSSETQKIFMPIDSGELEMEVQDAKSSKTHQEVPENPEPEVNIEVILSTGNSMPPEHPSSVTEENCTPAESEALEIEVAETLQCSGSQQEVPEGPEFCMPLLTNQGEPIVQPAEVQCESNIEFVQFNFSFAKNPPAIDSVLPENPVTNQQFKPEMEFSTKEKGKVYKKPKQRPTLIPPLLCSIRQEAPKRFWVNLKKIDRYHATPKFLSFLSKRLVFAWWKRTSGPKVKMKNPV